jgi:glycosyltransferase involved in cell wall biosynthesis
VTAQARPVRVLHIITRMVLGGAQENTTLSCAMIDRTRFPSELLTGPESGPEGLILTDARARGVVVHIEPYLGREVHPVRELAALIRLARFIRRGRYDVVHTHTSKAGILGRMAARLAGTPIVVHTAHGLSYKYARSRLSEWIYVRLERLCAHWSHAIVVVSESVQRDLLAHGIGHASQYELIRSGIEIEAFRRPALGRLAVRQRLGLAPEAFVVGCVGRLSQQKAPLDMVAAFVQLARRRPDVHLVMVGDGPLRREVEAAVAAAGLDGRVHLTGFRRDVPDLLGAFDVLALSSRFEGLPRVFPQAMAAAIPIVATRVDGAVEAVTDGENGWLVEPGDVAALADRLCEVASQPEQARRMGERGRERVEMFSAERMVRQIEA